MSTIYQVDATNVIPFSAHVQKELFGGFPDAKKLTHSVTLSHGFYASEDNEYLTGYGVFYDAVHRAPVSELAHITLPGTLWHMGLYRWEPLCLFAFRTGLITCIVIPQPGDTNSKSVAYCCRKLTSLYGAPVLRVNLSPTCPSLLQIYGTRFTPSLYSDIPAYCMSATSTDTEYRVKAKAACEWATDPLPVYARRFYRMMTDFNVALSTAGKAYTCNPTQKW